MKKTIILAVAFILSVATFAKKDEIKAEEIFTISNETAFIEWALQNDRSLLKIEIRIGEVKKWLAKKENQDKHKYPFLKSEVKIK